MYFDKKRKYWRVSITLPTGKRKDFCSKCKIIAIANENKFINKYKEKIKATIENDKTSEGLLLKEINKNLMKFKIKYFKKINLSLQRKLYYKKNKEHIKKRNKVYKESVF